MGNPTLSRIKRLQTRAQVFLDEEGFGSKDQSEFSRAEKFAHFWVMVGKAFSRNRCMIRASALAYTTLLALIPVLAIILSVTAGIMQKKGEEGIKQMIENVVAKVAPQLDLMPAEQGLEGSGGSEEVASKIYKYVKNFQRGTLSVTAVIALLFVGISLLSTIEATFNDIWGVPCGRSLFNRVVQYWAAISLGPILLLVVLGFATAPHFNFSREIMGASPFLGAIISSVIPFLGLALTFGLFYKMMPNTKVIWRAAFIGGLVASGLWWMNSNLNVFYVNQVALARNNEVFGKLGLVPVFLIGLYLSWLIMLFGAQVSYAYQNRETYVQDKQAETVNARGREFIALRIMTVIGDRFQQGSTPPTLQQIADALGVPSRLAGKVIEPLLKTNLLVESKGTETGFVPARPLEQITYDDILAAIQAGQGREVATKDDHFRASVREEFERIKEAQRQTAGRVNLGRLIQQNKNSPVDPALQEAKPLSQVEPE